MLEKFCPKCGKTVEKLYDNLCKQCFLEKFSVLEKLPRKVTIAQCKHCDRYVIGKNVTEDFDEVLKREFKEILKLDYVDKLDYIAVEDKINLKIFLKIDKLRKIENAQLPFKTKKITCQYCNMRLSGYHNAILQVSCPTELKEEILELIENKINLLARKDNLAFVAEKVDTPRGFTLKIGSKSAAKKIAKIMKKEYEAEIKLSRKLVGRKYGKNVYRLTISIRLG
jgi:nonsense-mediated mRNA decay protein 3